MLAYLKLPILRIGRSPLISKRVLDNILPSHPTKRHLSKGGHDQTLINKSWLQAGFKGEFDCSADRHFLQSTTIVLINADGTSKGVR